MASNFSRYWISGGWLVTIDYAKDVTAGSSVHPGMAAAPLGPAWWRGSSATGPVFRPLPSQRSRGWRAAQHRRNFWWGSQDGPARPTVAVVLVHSCQDRLGRDRGSSPHRKPPARGPGLLLAGVGHNGLDTQEGRAHPRKDGSRPQPRSSPPRTVCTAHSGFRSAPELLTSPQAGSNVHLDTSRSLAGPTPVLPSYFTSPS